MKLRLSRVLIPLLLCGSAIAAERLDSIDAAVRSRRMERQARHPLWNDPLNPKVTGVLGKEPPRSGIEDTQRIKDLGKQLDIARQEYLKDVSGLMRKLKDATPEQRKGLKEKIDKRHQEWRQLLEGVSRETHGAPARVDQPKQPEPARK